MKEDISSLIGVLEKERDSYQELLDRAREEQQIILEGNMDELPPMVKTVEELVCRTRDIEKERLELLDSISADLQSPQKIESLSQLIAYMDPSSSRELDRLQDLQKGISQIANDLATTNRANSDMLRRNLGYIDFLFSLLADEEQAYPGTPDKKTVSSKLFDQRI